MPDDENKIIELFKIFHSLKQEDQEWVVAVLPRILKGATIYIKKDDRQN